MNLTLAPLRFMSQPEPPNSGRLAPPQDTTDDDTDYTCLFANDPELAALANCATAPCMWCKRKKAFAALPS
jgi:hypothetical protein